MANTKMGYSSFLIRDFPNDLKNAAKHRAIDDGCTLKDIIIKAIRIYLENHKSSG